ncbi:hypothetical protein FDE04_24460 [Vibrio parahaemolyticus]|nr:hypothetical protein [Vibrio parahaemolyticus]EGR0997637.1 hypothetical protein [Vibrio parahaemolyticus]EGR3441931.1 hypothetical protein [Vibrio parahaemolyticus]MQC42430.1 hypothetical protein [Vibrio parahaemolyticus]MQC67594.1 hypothetical protein [Vibrio parahaemolyticus]
MKQFQLHNLSLYNVGKKLIQKKYCSRSAINNYAHNKQFKRDSQRLALLLLLQIWCLWHNVLGRVVALFTP